jgi:hypothetical protein
MVPVSRSRQMAMKVLRWRYLAERSLKSRPEAQGRKGRQKEGWRGG